MIRFVITLQSTSGMGGIPVRKAVTIEEDDIDKAATTAIANLDGAAWFVVAVRQEDAIDGPSVL